MTSKPTFSTVHYFCFLKYEEKELWQHVCGISTLNEMSKLYELTYVSSYSTCDIHAVVMNEMYLQACNQFYRASLTCPGQPEPALRPN